MLTKLKDIASEVVTWIYVRRYNQVYRPHNDVLCVPSYVHTGRFMSFIVYDASKDNAYVIVHSRTHKNVMAYLYKSNRVRYKSVAADEYIVTVDEFCEDEYAKFKRYYIDSSCNTVDLVRIKDHIGTDKRYKDKVILGGVVWNKGKRGAWETLWRKFYLKLMRKMKSQ